MSTLSDVSYDLTRVGGPLARIVATFGRHDVMTVEHYGDARRARNLLEDEMQPAPAGRRAFERAHGPAFVPTAGRHRPEHVHPF